MADPKQTQQRLTFKAPEDRATELVLEPWGEQHRLPAGSEVDVVAEGPEGGSFEVELEFEGDLPRLSVWAWHGATAHVTEPIPANSAAG
jgi:hypothetical protein